MEREIVDHYGVLGLPSGTVGAKVTEAEIRKAYRVQALRSHPDKRPDDPNAAEEFLKIQTAYDILTNSTSRRAFDELLRLRYERRAREEARTVEVSVKRRKMMDDLAEREKTFELEKQRQRQEEKAAETLREEIAKLRTRYAQNRATTFRNVFEQQETKNEKENSGSSLEKEKMLKVSWDCITGDYNSERLREIFKGFGKVEDVVIRRKQSKKKGSAIVVMGSADEVAAAARNLCGDLSNPLLVRPFVDSAPNSFGQPSQEEEESDKALHKVVGAGYQAFENEVLEKMRKAAEKARAAKQSQN
eukprot:TRINITY_DN12890_c0_g1_i1.p1 TRINITY_DN12890_c0_g1~~TRINITY_DN12890_c0_g1_i1.p1  ORF type:complete len:303 (-),score=54.98 TRINITY_DN12890_c0_g1_i1:443-1351(-)